MAGDVRGAGVEAPELDGHGLRVAIVAGSPGAGSSRTMEGVQCSRIASWR